MNRLIPYLVISSVIHVGILTGFDRLTWLDPVVAGHGAASREIFVTIVAEREQTAEAETPASENATPSEAATPPEEKKPETKEEPPPDEVVEPDREEDKEIASDHQLLARTVEDPQVDLKTGEEGAEPELTPTPKPEVEKTTSEEVRKKPDEPEEPEITDEEVIQAWDVEEPKKPDETEKPIKTASKSAEAAQQSALSSFRAVSGNDLPDLRASVLAAIQQACYYPKRALRKKVSGRALVKFTLFRDGHIEALELLRSSGSKHLDKAATAIVEKAAGKFPKIPQTCLRDWISYVVPIDFQPRKSWRK